MINFPNHKQVIFIQKSSEDFKSETIFSLINDDMLENIVNKIVEKAQKDISIVQMKLNEENL